MSVSVHLRIYVSQQRIFVLSREISLASEFGIKRKHYAINSKSLNSKEPTTILRSFS